MRSCSGFSEILSLVILMALVSCASAPPSISNQDSFQLDGTIGVAGDQPFDRAIVLSDADGIKWNLDPGSLEAELSLLDGYMVSLTCSAVPGIGSEKDASVEEYHLLPPAGMTAMRGRIRIDDDFPSIVKSDGSSVILEGPLSEALGAFGGHLAWIWGEETGRDQKIKIRGYEILGP